MLALLTILMAVTLEKPACRELCEPEMMQVYSRFYLESFGDYREDAGFLHRTADGRLSVKKWPAGDRSSVSYKGRLPEQSIAIIHTHPRYKIEPSENDRSEAKRIQLPIIVLTIDAVTAAEPDGTVIHIVDGYGWMDRVNQLSR